MRARPAARAPRRAHHVGAALSDALFTLGELRELWLEYTCSSGTIPVAIANLTKLEVAKLHCNSFSGAFPTAALSGLTEQLILDFGRNPLTGEFPVLPRLAKLEKFSCNFCALNSTIPPDVFLAHPALIHTF